jgi:hypothetical protein
VFVVIKQISIIAKVNVKHKIGKVVLDVIVGLSNMHHYNLSRVCCMIATIAFVISVIQHAYSENYVYNFTKQEKDELFVSQMCVAGVELNVTSISECKYIYGGINSPYGEAVK